jgi:hypothetical protein
VTGSLGKRARGAEHGEAKAVTYSVGTEVERSSGWAELHRSAMVAVAASFGSSSLRARRSEKGLKGGWGGARAVAQLFPQGK